jgi:hypothetical protein
MLTEKLRHFYQLVETARGELGNNATRIADRIMSEALPSTAEAAEREGADKMLRVGVIEILKSYLKKDHSLGDVQQHDFADIDPAFSAIIKKLQNPSHYVPSLEQYVHVSVLIVQPALLDEARKFKRQKGEETLAEAKFLDELYSAVLEKHGGSQ